MNIVTTIEQYDQNNIILCDPIKNNIMNEGKFIRILYSDSNCILNGVYLFLTLEDIFCEKYYSKFKCKFDITLNKNIIDNIKIIEENLLKKYEIINKTPQFKLYDQFKNGNIKIMNEIQPSNSESFILKISGIWETHSNYGLTYKFLITK